MTPTERRTRLRVIFNRIAEELADLLDESDGEREKPAAAPARQKRTRTVRATPARTPASPENERLAKDLLERAGFVSTRKSA